MLGFLLVILGYLVGSIPIAYFVARGAKGIDIRRYGSGSVGASNVRQFLGLKGFILVAGLDIAKGASVVLISQILDMPVTERVLVGLATVAGHDWPIFLRFQGGRGVSTVAGAILVLVPKASLVAIPLTLLLIGASRNGPIPVAIGLAVLPAAGLMMYGPGVLFLGCIGLSLMAFAKRLQGSPEVSPGPTLSLARRLLYRLLYDRDTREREAWVSRRPPPGPAR